MESISLLMHGFSNALQYSNLLYALAGTGLGMLVGVLPGLGPAAAVALLLPFSFALDTTGAIIMLIAIYYGSLFRGTITAVLLNVPGEATSAITCFDGHPLAKEGRAGPALFVAAISSATGGLIATIALVIAAPIVAGFAFKFGPPEQLALLVFSLSLLMGLSGASMIKTLIMGIFGLTLGTVGLDPTQAYPRFTFGVPELFEGLSFVPIVMGLFGLADIFVQLEHRAKKQEVLKIGKLMPSKSEWRSVIAPIARGSGIGFFLGLIPGMMPSISSFIAYSSEKSIAKNPERFGKGAVEGVAAPEAANNSHAQATLIPLLTMGIPTTPTIALILGAFLVNGIVPGPLLFRDNPTLVWTIIASFFVGNILLLIWNLPLIRMWVSILKIPPSILYTIIIVLMIIGSYSEYNGIFGVCLLLGAGCFGYWMKKLDFPVAPLILTLVLGPMLEESLIRTLEMYPSGGVIEIFHRPIVLGMSLLTICFFLFFIYKSFSRRSVSLQQLPGGSA
ncbi:tripartite tricarboxylate transporter permease [Paenalcaligenes niemegkensis]|uniref:tripartite tricarboxylate transporter permease n=1 Tax=Paenalcaligenes niemegkensis TaxID=2895469 RepID=UPI001EE92BB0|nr:tripartite tricarboxylate transporter permease [Paenalcaligenes niemegkensis]MCQ9617682.1 tripartite tricarboxylate transporter permease [Paenalcaligenes niemegkensis]